MESRTPGPIVVTRARPTHGATVLSTCGIQVPDPDPHQWRVPCRTVSRTEDFLHVGGGRPAMRELEERTIGAKVLFNAHPCTIDRRRADKPVRRTDGRELFQGPRGLAGWLAQCGWTGFVHFCIRSTLPIRSPVRPTSSTGRPDGLVMFGSGPSGLGTTGRPYSNTVRYIRVRVVRSSCK